MREFGCCCLSWNSANFAFSFVFVFIWCYLGQNAQAKLNKAKNLEKGRRKRKKKRQRQKIVQRRQLRYSNGTNVWTLKVTSSLVTVSVYG